MIILKIFVIILYEISIGFSKSFSFLVAVMTLTMPLQKEKVRYS